MKRPAGAVLIAAVFAIGSQFAVAETFYVRDTIYVPLRSGPSSQHRVIRQALRSGTPLELLDVQADGGWVNVRMEDGTEGWIQNQYLQQQRIASERLTDAQERIAELEANYQQTLLRVQELESANAELEAKNADLREENRRLAEELDRITNKAGDVLAIDRENKQLSEENEALQEELAEVRLANEELQEDTRQDWFLRGAGVILLGLLFGFWVGRRIYHRSGGGWWT